MEREARGKTGNHGCERILRKQGCYSFFLYLCLCVVCFFYGEMKGEFMTREV